MLSFTNKGKSLLSSTIVLEIAVSISHCLHTIQSTSHCGDRNLLIHYDVSSRVIVPSAAGKPSRQTITPHEESKCKRLQLRGKDLKVSADIVFSLCWKEVGIHYWFLVVSWDTDAFLSTQTDM